LEQTIIEKLRDSAEIRLFPCLLHLQRDVAKQSLGRVYRTSECGEIGLEIRLIHHLTHLFQVFGSDLSLLCSKGILFGLLLGRLPLLNQFKDLGGKFKLRLLDLSRCDLPVSHGLGEGHGVHARQSESDLRVLGSCIELGLELSEFRFTCFGTFTYCKGLGLCALGRELRCRDSVRVLLGALSLYLGRGSGLSRRSFPFGGRG